MKSSQKSKKPGHDNDLIGLPTQRVWNKLEKHELEVSLNENSKLDCKKIKKIGRLLDRAFQLLLEKLIRQN